jgi:hypothetical protein
MRGFVGSAFVLFGGLVVSTLPRSSALLEIEGLVTLRGAEAGRMAALTLIMIGLGMVASQWLALCRHVAHAEGEDRADALALVRHATVVWSAPLLLAPPLFSRDGWSYAAQGMLAHVGLSPYENGPSALHGPIVQAVDPRWMDTITPYGPVPLTLGEIGAGITGNPWLLAVGHRVVALCGLILLAWAVPRLAQWNGVNPALASGIVLASPLMLTNGVGGMHNDLLMAGLMAAALVVAGQWGWPAAAVIGGLAAAVKVPGGLVCIGVVLLSLPAAATLAQRLRRLGAVAGVSFGTLVGLGVVSGLGVGWVQGLTVPGSVITPFTSTALVGGAGDWVAGVLGLGLPNATFLDLARSLGTAAMLGVSAWVALAWPTADRAGAVRGVAIVTLTAVVLSPVVHPWYLLWATPFLASIRLPRVGLVGLLAGSLILGLAAPLDSSLHGAYVAIALCSMLLALLIPLLLLTASARARIERISTAPWIPV